MNRARGEKLHGHETIFALKSHAFKLLSKYMYTYRNRFLICLITKLPRIAFHALRFSPDSRADVFLLVAATIKIVRGCFKMGFLFLLPFLICLAPTVAFPSLLVCSRRP